MKAVTNSWKHIALSALTASILSVSLMSVPTFAQHNSFDSGGGGGGGGCDTTFLGFPAWYNGLTQDGADGGCDIKSPTEVGGVDKFVWIIVFNVVVMLLRLAGYAAVAFIIYGGYKYMISAGSPDGMVAARKTIMNAVIGLIISIAAVAIVNTISGGLKIGAGG